LLSFFPFWQTFKTSPVLLAVSQSSERREIGVNLINLLGGYLGTCLGAYLGAYLGAQLSEVIVVGHQNKHPVLLAVSQSSERREIRANLINLLGACLGACLVAC